MGRPPDAEKKANILASAFRAFGERGFARTTMKTIARQAGIAPGSIYIYFRDKQALFDATVEQGWEQFLSELAGTAVSERPFRERLAMVVDLGFAKLKEGLPLLQGMLFEASRRRLLHSKLDSLCRTLENLFAEARPKRGSRLLADGARRKTMIRVTVIGIMFSAALAAPERTDAELAFLKSAVRRMLEERLGP
jgi:AcrR family transcriptional regulator